MVTLEQVEEIKTKQLELGLTNEQCSKVIGYLMEGFVFTDAELDFEEYVLDFLKKSEEKSNG